MRTNKIGRYKLYRTLGEGSFAKVKCNTKINIIKKINKKTKRNNNFIICYIIKK
jgi:serine/threonine protein kinase